MATRNLFSGPVCTLLEDNKVNKKSASRGIATHTSMTGGSYHLDETTQNELHRLMSVVLGQEDAVMPCLTEQRTTVFGLYIDFDGKFPVASLSDKALAQFMGIVTSQLRRFYVDMDEERWSTHVSRAIVLHKKHGATLLADGRYKHGLHIHFPNLYVNADQARSIRMGLMNGLLVHVWSDEFGIERPPWDEIIDESVYNCGLRMIRAPKAQRCGTCRADVNNRACDECHKSNMGYIIEDRNVYDLHAAFENGRPSPTYLQFVGANGARLARAVSVRSTHMDVTPGFEVYPGCPPAARASSSSSAGGRRKRPFGLMDGDAHRMQAKYRNGEDVTDSAKVAVVHAQLCKHSEMYRSCCVVSIKKYKNTLCVGIMGDNATYCLNKRDKHNSNRVWMLIKQGNSATNYQSNMKCYCRCATPRLGEEEQSAGKIGISGKLCSGFTSEERSLTRDQVRVLFPTPKDIKQKEAQERNIPPDMWEMYHIEQMITKGQSETTVPGM